MAGDVFGNGMLLCRRGKLVAAFNHKHIFLDPAPDLARSYAERERLFNKPGSTWADFDQTIISEGGGVFSRSEKEINLSPQAQKMLDLAPSTVSGPELILAILRAPVDMLWNGGIGTYVKASFETHTTVNDPLNDDVRISADELRAKVVAEGGNLGFTQNGRIEFARLGGRINTDAIDNSGGVNLSDIEVNWKILLAGPVARGDLSISDRDSLLADATNEAVARVIRRNSSQCLTLSMGEKRSIVNLRPCEVLIEHLEQVRQLDRALEKLPSASVFSDLCAHRAGLVRPELAVLMAYAKMDLADKILASDIPESAIARDYLFTYFPQAWRARFADDISKHPLHREIVATRLANQVIETLGSTFVYRYSRDAVESSIVLRSFLAAEEIMALRELAGRLRPADKPRSVVGFLHALSSLGACTEAAARWFLDRSSQELNSVEQHSATYASEFCALGKNVESILDGEDLVLYRQAVQQRLAEGLEADQASAICALPFAPTFLEVCLTAFTAGRDVLDVARLFSAVSADFRISTLLEACTRVEVKDHWEEQATGELGFDIRRSVHSIVAGVLKSGLSDSGPGSSGNSGASGIGAPRQALHDYLGSRAKEVALLRSALAEAHNHPLTLPVLQVLSARLRAVAGRG